MLELLFGRQLELIAAHEYVSIAGGRKANDLSIPFGTEKNSHWWILFLIRDVFGEVVDIEPKLSSVLGFESTRLQVDGNEAAQPPMEQQQVDIVVPVAGSNSELPGDEAEVAS